MKKGIKTATAGLLVASSLFLCGDKTAGQKEEIAPRTLTRINTSFRPFYTSKGKYITTHQKRAEKAEMGLKKAVKPLKATKPYKEMTVLATAYISFCETGCTGITATGTDVRHTIYKNGLPIVAVDPSVIPLGSIIEFDGRKYIADDTGGAIKGKHIDVLVSTHNKKKAIEFGKRFIKIKVYPKR